MKEQSAKIQEYLNNFIPQLKDFVKSETVFGEPIKVDNTTLIPVHSVKVGFGFGDAKKESSAGGGGVVLTPVAFIAIQKDIVTIHSITAGNIENLLDKIPNFLERTYSLVEKIMNKKETPE